MLNPRAPPGGEEPINVPDPRAEHIDFSRECKRCQVECDYCKGWRPFYQPEGGDPISASRKE